MAQHRCLVAGKSDDKTLVALNGLLCTDVPLRNYSRTPSQCLVAGKSDSLCLVMSAVQEVQLDCIGH